MQTAAEAAIVDATAVHLGIDLLRHREATTISLGKDVRVEVDAASPDRSVVVEACARQGRLKGAQLRKVAQDILKLALLQEGSESKSIERFIVFASTEAEQSVKGWVREAAERFGIRFLVVDVPQELRDSILTAQSRQVMVNVDQVADDVGVPSEADQ
ncbi:MAG: hypothetical protein DLM57_01955 [Pseudonocardiales bacterium]|nr:MAG: hypothetical protein DLM57_01955 [Pseudonocardiales bacterium]